MASSVSISPDNLILVQAACTLPRSALTPLSTRGSRFPSEKRLRGLDELLVLLFCRYSFQPLHLILNARSPSNGIEPTYGKAIDVSRPRCHLNYQPTVLERGQKRVSRRGFLEQRVAHNLLRKAESAPTRPVG